MLQQFNCDEMKILWNALTKKKNSQNKSFVFSAIINRRWRL